MFHSFILSLCSNTLTLESIFEYIRQKLIKNMLILKFHPGMKCLHVFFSFFHPGMKFHPCLSSRDEISSRQKRVNSKRHFTIDRDDFIPGRVSSRDEISRANTLLLRNSTIFIVEQFILVCSKLSFNIIAHTANTKIFYKKPYQTFLGLNL